MAASYAPEALLERARALAPELRKRSLETSRARSMSKATIDDYWNADLWYLLKPKKFGGPEVRVDDAFNVAYELARGDGSAAWIWTVLGVHDLLMCYFPEKAQQEYWAKDRTLSASSLAPGGGAKPAEGGFTLSGKWSFCSGIDHAEWMILAAVFGMVSKEPPIPDIRFVLVPKSDVKVIDDWHVMGLQGTGSKSCVLENAFVPAHRVVSMKDMLEGTTPGADVHPSSKLYRAPIWALFPFCISSPAAGIARGAFDTFVESIKGRQTHIDHAPIAKKPNIQMRVAEAGALIDAADLLYKRSLKETIDKAMAGERMTPEFRIRNRRDQGFAVRMAKQAADLLLTGEGGMGLFEDRHVQRAARDLQAVSGHIVAGWDIPALCYGSITLGTGPTDFFW
jgi:alkylation response protein AidB-like acyl-CoA dehydrogenase